MTAGAIIPNGIIAGLYVLYRLCKGSTKRHVPKAFLSKKLVRGVEGYAGDILKDLRKAGYVNIYKGRTESYAITVSGIKKLKELGII